MQIQFVHATLLIAMMWQTDDETPVAPPPPLSPNERIADPIPPSGGNATVPPSVVIPGVTRNIGTERNRRTREFESAAGEGRGLKPPSASEFGNLGEGSTATNADDHALIGNLSNFLEGPETDDNPEVETRRDPLLLLASASGVDAHGFYGEYKDGTRWRYDGRGNRWLYDASGKPTMYWEQGVGWVAYNPGDPGETIEILSPEILVDRHTSLLDLDESRLGRTLAVSAVQGSFEYVNDVLDELDWGDRDDVGLGLMEAVSDEMLGKMEATDEGRRFLSRLFHELTEGVVAEDELAQARRILVGRANRISPLSFARAVETAKVFPFRQPGPTVLESAPINAKVLPNGKIHVEMPRNETRADIFAPLVDKLPSDLFLGGIEIDSREIIGVKDFSTGQTQYWPALYLVQVSNRSDSATLGKVAAVSIFGVTLGTGSIAGETGVFLWASRAEAGVSGLSLFVNDHRKWVAETLGEDFLAAYDKLESAAQVYGAAKAVYALAGTTKQLTAAHRSWRQQKGTLTEQAAEFDAAMKRVADASPDTNALPYPKSTGATAGSGETFMNRQLRIITADLDNHPLRFLVDPKTKKWKARTHLSELPTVQAGHLTSKHSGAADRFAIEDSFFNQVSNWRGETQGAVFNKQAVEIEGVIVEARTAAMWRSIGLIP